MARAGRKRKTGDRYKSGGLRPVIDRGPPELALQRARSVGRMTRAEAELWAQGRADEAVRTVANIGGDGSDAIGRAYVAGFLTHPTIPAGALKDAGRVLFKLYWSHYSELRGMSINALARVVGGGGGSGTGDGADHLEQALNTRLDAIGKRGREVRLAVEALCIDHNLDSGPAWLDRLIRAKSCDVAFVTEDWVRMQRAIDGLAEIA